MICPKCDANNDKVVDSRPSDTGRSVRRRRLCLECSHKWTTSEEVDAATGADAPKATLTGSETFELTLEQAKLVLFFLESEVVCPGPDPVLMTDRGRLGLQAWEKMRRSDGQIRAMLQVMKLPLRAAVWTTEPLKDGDKQDQEISNFIQAALFDDDAMDMPWDDVLQHILLQLDFGFCVDTDTEILTTRGWKRHDQIAIGERVYTLNPDSGLAVWQPVNAVHRFTGPHAMRHLKSEAHDSLTTAKHKWFIGRHSQQYGTQETEWTTTARLNTNHVIWRGALCADIPAESTFEDASDDLVAKTEEYWH